MSTARAFTTGSFRARRFTYLALQGYGDSLISLQLLALATPLPGPVRVVGTAETSQILNAMFPGAVPFMQLFPEHAAFYRIKTAGLRRSFKEMWMLRSWVHAELDDNDVVLCEKSDVRNYLTLGLQRVQVVQPRRSESVYLSRKQMLEGITGRRINLPSCTRPARQVRSVIVNPSARLPHKELTPDAVRNLITVLNRRGVRTSVIDPQMKFSWLRDAIECYHTQIDLARAIELLQEHDLYIGPDSFFIHLAYYYKVPFVAVLPHSNYQFRFAPPGCKELGNTLTLREFVHHESLSVSLMPFLS